MNTEIREHLKQAQFVLVGIGEEFYDFKRLKTLPEYAEVAELLEKGNKAWLIPLWNYYFLKKNTPKVQEALQKLAELLEDKNYFVISVCANGMVQNAGFHREQVVSPCGSCFKLQCPEHCQQGILEVSNETLKEICKKLEQKRISDISFGKCPACGQELCLNNVYTEKYDENGYLQEWNTYTKWLQGTLNRKLAILELGVNLTYPSVIRWPFEKVGFYNQKAIFIRVNETLFQMTEDLKDKGISIPKNSIDWLLEEDL